MTTRIRYQTVNGLLTLKKPLLAGSDLLLVTLDPKNLEAVITSINTHLPVAAVKGKNLNDLKKNVKNQFKILGVVFNDEVRPGRVLNKVELKKLNEQIIKDNDEILEHINNLLDAKTKGVTA